MGHVLGLVGTLGDCSSDCSNSYNYPCPLAQQENMKQYFLAAFSSVKMMAVLVLLAIIGMNRIFLKAPLGRSSELMTGYFESAGIGQPISSRVTVAALDESFTDYIVDYCQGDPLSEVSFSLGDDNTKKSKILRPTETFSLEGRIERRFTAPIAI